MTRFDARHGRRALYLLPYAAEDELPEGVTLPDSAVCARMGGAEKEIYPEVFDSLGAALLEAAKPADVIVIDELGYLEAEAHGFREAVLNTLRGTKPVVGVVRQGFGAWRDAPLGELVTVTAENRDSVPETVLAWLRRETGG